MNEYGVHVLYSEKYNRMYIGCSEVSCKPTRLIQPIQNGIDAKAKYKMGKTH